MTALAEVELLHHITPQYGPEAWSNALSHLSLTLAGRPFALALRASRLEPHPSGTRARRAGHLFLHELVPLP